MFFYFIFLKQIFRHKDQIRGILIIFVAKSRRPEDLWVIQTELENPLASRLLSADEPPHSVTAALQDETIGLH